MALQYILIPVFLVSLPILSMDHIETVDEIAQNYFAQIHFSQTTVNPALLSVAASSSSENDCMSAVEIPTATVEPETHTHQPPRANQELQKKNAILVKTKTFDFVRGGTTYLHKFSTSPAALKKKSLHQQGMLLELALELLKSAQEPTATMPNEVKLAAKIQKRIKNKITAEQANQWLYFKNKPIKKRRYLRKKS